MADYNDIILTRVPQAIPVAAEDTMIYATGPIRLTSHQAPAGNTVGIPLNQQAHIIKANTTLMAWADAPAGVLLVRTTV